MFDVPPDWFDDRLADLLDTGETSEARWVSSSRVTRRLPTEVSATSANASRLKSSTMASIRKRRLQESTSATRSSDQRWLGDLGYRRRCPGAGGAFSAALAGDFYKM